MLKRVDYYILKNLALSFVVSFLIITLIMIIGDIVKIYDILFSEGSSLGFIFKVLFDTAVFLSVFTIPMALTIAVNYVYSDMSLNSEITAFRSSGISLIRVYFPAFLLSLFVFVLMIYDIGFLANSSKFNYKTELTKALKGKIYLALKPDTFYDKLDGVLWAKELSADRKKLKEVFFANKNQVFVAKRSVLSDLNNGILATFFDVKMYSEKKGIVEYGSFDVYKVAFLVTKSSVYKKNDPRFMNVVELYNLFKKTHNTEALFEIHRMIALSLSVFMLSLVAFGFGINFARSGKSAGIVLSLFIFFAYYILYSIAKTFYHAHHIFWPLYLPDIILAALGFYIFLKKIRV